MSERDPFKTPDPFKISEEILDLWRDYIWQRDLAAELESENARLKSKIERISSAGKEPESLDQMGSLVPKRLARHWFDVSNELRAENDRLKAEVADLKANVQTWQEEALELGHEKELMTRAGDAMAKAFDLKYPVAGGLINDWNAAKEGNLP